MRSFCQVGFGFCQGHAVQPLLLRFAEIDGNLLDRGGDDEQVSIDKGGEQAAGVILVNHRSCAHATAFTIIQHRDAAAANRDNHHASRYKRAHRLDLDYFDDMQRELNLSSPTSGVAQTIVNTADAEILGFEVEARYALTDNFLLTGNVGLLDAEYTDVIFDISGNGTVGPEDLSLALPRVPETTYGVGVLYDLDLGSRGSLVSRASFQHRDEFAYTDNNFGYVDPADQVDANLTWNTPYEGFSVSLFAKNLLDEAIAGGDTQVPFGGALAGAVPDGQNLSDGTNDAFDPNPAAGTFQPLQPGRTIGIEFTIRG